MQSPSQKNGYAGLDPILVNRLFGFALLVLVGAIVLFLRNPDPILNPALYAEDATWVGPLLQGDPWTAYFYSRRDYLVLGQTMILDLAVSLNLALTGGTIAVLPQTLAFLSYGFWSFYAALTFVALRPFMSAGWRLLAVALIVLLPLGGSGNEVIGRIANLGYLFLPLSLTLVLLRETRANRGVSFLAVCGLVVCLFTNPLCALVIAGHLALRAVRRLWHRTRLSLVSDATLVLALLAFTILFFVRGGESVGAVPPGSVFTPERLAELLGARSFLYPFAFAYYAFLTDRIVTFIVLAVTLLAFWAIYVADARQRLLGLSLGACLIATTLLVVAARPWLTDFMRGYGPTFPDRYFIAQNVFAILTLVWILSRLPHLFGMLGASAVVLLMASGVGTLFEFNHPQMPVVTDEGYADRVALTARIHVDADPNALVILDSYPDGFATVLPAGTLVRTAAALPVRNATLPGVSHLDLGILPNQLAAMERAAAPGSTPGQRAPSLPVAVMNDLASEDGVLLPTGEDPYMVYGTGGLAPDDGTAVRLAFDLVCVGRTRPVRMQLFWQTAQHNGMDEARSIHFTAHPGRIMVPLAVHPSFTGRETLDAIRLDIDAPRACPGYRFENVALERR